MSTSNTAKEEKENQIFDFEAHQPDRVIDEVMLYGLWKKALYCIMKHKFSIMAESLNLTSMEFTKTKEIPTACYMNMGYSKKIIININFILDVVFKDLDLNTPEGYNKAVEEFASVIAHEMMHHLLKHCKHQFYANKIKNKFLENAAMDVFINHYLGKIFGFQLDWSNAYLSHKTLQYLSPNVVSSLPFVKIINEGRASVPQIAEFLLEEDKKNGGDGKGEGGGGGYEYTFMGSHGDKEGQGNKQQPQEGAPMNPNDVPEEIKDMIRQMAKSCSKFGEFFEDSILVKPDKNKILEEMLRKTEIMTNIQGEHARFCKTHGKGNIEYKRNYPGRDLKKREKILLAEGFDLTRFTHKRGSTKTKAIAFIDVSGSVVDLIPAFYGMFSKASEAFDLQIFVFSTTLNPVTLQELKTGKVPTTGGTCFNTWAKHLAESQDITAALIVTDGYGDCEQEYLDKIKSNKTILNALVVDGGKMPDYIKDQCRYVWDLQIGRQ